MDTNKHVYTQLYPSEKQGIIQVNIYRQTTTNNAKLDEDEVKHIPRRSLGSWSECTNSSNQGKQGKDELLHFVFVEFNL